MTDSPDRAVTAGPPVTAGCLIAGEWVSDGQRADRAQQGDDDYQLPREQLPGQ